MGEGEKPEKVAHANKMEVRRFYAGILLFMVLAGVEIFFKPVPVVVWGAAIVVLGLDIEALSKILLKR